MFFVEESIMSKRVLSLSLSRFVVSPGLLLAALAGCSTAESRLHGYVDVVPSGVRAAGCEAPLTGQLQLQGMQAGDVATVSADELCHRWVVRKELPAGLYTVSWQPSDDGDSDGASWEVRDAGIVNVFPEQATTVRVLKLEPDPTLLSQASPEASAELSQW
jgi:hypothetical protein